MPSMYIISAKDANGGIGKNGLLPWNLQKELQHFKTITLTTKDPLKKNAVIMGRRTWDSLPVKFRPLIGRQNIVLTKNHDFQCEGALVFYSIDDALMALDENIENVFIIGGGALYREAITHPKLDGIYLTEIHEKFDCDTFFPKIPKTFSQKQKLGEGSEQGIDFTFYLYTKK